MPESSLSVSPTRDHCLHGADGGHCALVEVPTVDTPVGEVLLVPGMFTARGFWLSPRGIGLAAHLSEAGFRCWILERRGTGAARRQHASVRTGMSQAIRHDLPAAFAHIRAQSGGAIFIVAHSFGGILAARALAGPIPARECAGLVTFATQCEAGKAPLRPPGSWLTLAIAAMLGHLPARLAGLGPEDEPRAAMQDAVRWTTSARRGAPWLNALRALALPQLALAGAGDTIDPPEGCARFARRLAAQDAHYELLSRDRGWAEDYDHAGMVVSRNARDEVWPYVTDWLRARLPAQPNG